MKFLRVLEQTMGVLFILIAVSTLGEVIFKLGPCCRISALNPP